MTDAEMAAYNEGLTDAVSVVEQAQQEKDVSLDEIINRLKDLITSP